MREMATDLLVVGGGLGGVAAALAGARSGRSVVLTEETGWLGGQLTSQAVPPDEHPWIEGFGCPRSYRRLRDGIRRYYRDNYPLSPTAHSSTHLNPGAGHVSGLCHEPRVALAVIEAMLAPFRSSGKVTVLTDHRPIAVETSGDRVEAVTLGSTLSGGRVCIIAPFVLDATETGELLPMSRTEYVTGFESCDETGEPHAPPTAQPLNMQAVSACFAMEHRAGEDHTIERPERYAFWRAHEPPVWPGKLLNWTAPDPRTMEPYARRLVPNPQPDVTPPPGTPTKDLDGDLWRFRRILARKNFAAGFYASDVTLVNWPMIDYSRSPIFEVPQEEAIRHVEDARQLSLSLLYWMQTEAPRPDGGTGYPGLRPRPDVVGTDDGLAKRLYVRESRRIRAEYTVVEQDLASEVRGPLGAKIYPDSVGVGAYRIDLHPSTGGDAYIDVGAHPFEIPLGALIPIRTRNLLPAAKNIGTTHITNGAYRLHPVEWTVGEVAGHLAAFCLERSVSPSEVRAEEILLGEFQRRLTEDGGELRWPSSVHAL
jgi:hypothetical protein